MTLVALVALFLYLHGLAHRAGHDLGSRLAARGAPSSPAAERATERLSALLRYPAPGRLASRHTVALHPACSAPERGLRWALIGGPLADQLLLVLALGAACAWRSPLLVALAGCAVLLLVLDLLPAGPLENDAAVWRTVRRGGASADRLLALALLEGAVRDGQLPRAFDRGLILRATARPDGSRAAVLADLFAYYRALDLGEMEAAEALLERLRHAAPRRPRALPALIVAESAYLALRLRGDLQAADSLVRAECARGWWSRQAYMAAGHAHPGTHARIAVQGRILLGQAALAQQRGSQALLAVARRQNDGPTAAQQALCEREWLSALVDAAPCAPHGAPAMAAPTEARHGALQASPPAPRQRRVGEGRLTLMLLASLLASLAAAVNVVPDHSDVRLPDISAAHQHTLQMYSAAALPLALAMLALVIVLRSTARARRSVALLALLTGFGLVALGAALRSTTPFFVDGLLLGGCGAVYAVCAGTIWNGAHTDGGSLVGALRALSPSHLLVFGILAALPLGGIALSLTGGMSLASGSTPGINRGDHAPAIRARYVYDADVPQYARDDVRRGVSLAASYFWVTFGRTIERPIEVDVTLGNAEPGALGYADFHQVRIGVGDVSEPLSSTELQNVVVHELFHVLQSELGAGRGLDGGPAWLVEGSADFVANEAQVWHGDVDQNDVDACWQANVLAQRALPDLQTLTSEQLMTAGPGRYDLAALAVAEATRGVGAPALRTYFADLATGDWQAAFHQAFGVEPQTFFARYATLRRSFNAPADACAALAGD